MKNWLTILLLAASFSAYGQSAGSSDSIWRQAVVDMGTQYLIYPQEKIYLQTDRPYYINGEKIFFRIFLLHPATRKHLTMSRYVYVELLTPTDSLAIRQMIRLDENGFFYGTLTLPEGLADGNYLIRAYTRYMENTGEAHFFTRPVYIADPNATRVEMESSFEYPSSNQVLVRLRFKVPESGEISYPQKLELNLNQKKSTTVEPDEDGWFSAKFNLKEEESRRTLVTNYSDGKNSFKKYLRIPYGDKKPEIIFYPEGGDIIAGESNRIAFKSLLSDGSPIGIEGSVYNSANELQNSFSTRHDGMGDFILEARAGESYYAQCTYDGQPIRVDLPEVKANGYSLAATYDKDSVALSIRGISAGVRPKFYLLIHTQGRPAYFREWDYSKEQLSWSREKFPAYMSHMLLLAEDLRPVSERLFFNYREEEGSVDYHVGKKSYKAREKVALDIRFSDFPTDSIPGTFAISVTDDKDMKVDTTTHILSEILLSSELEGHINSPAWYFGYEEEKAKAADLLTLTHGWRRYHVTEALQGNLQKPAIMPEISQALSGVVKGKRGGISKKAVIRMKVIGYDLSEAYEVDEEGRYLFDNFEFPDSTAYYLHANSSKRKPDVVIVPDADHFPEITSSTLYPGEAGSSPGREELPGFASKADMKYLQENGMRMIYLPEVTVSARQKKEKKRLDNRSVMMDADRWLSPEEIEELAPVSWDDLFNRVSGSIQVSPENVTVRNQAVQFVLNGIPLRCSFSELDSYVSVTDVGQVELFTSLASTLVFSSSGGPVIVLTTWPPGMRKASDDDNAFMKILLPMGYQNRVDFYSPKYDTPEALRNPNPDLRTTIYWNPNLLLPDGDKVSVEFYTADTPTTYTVVTEGVAPGRKLIYHRSKALIEVKK